VPAEGDLADLPPTLVTTSAIDALEEQAMRYLESLATAGVTVAHHRADDVLHGYLNLVGTVAAADAHLARHLDLISEWIAT
jgi:acetyl esterase/lipase